MKSYRSLVVILSLALLALVWWAWPHKNNEPQVEKSSETAEQMTVGKTQATPQSNQAPSEKRQAQFPKRQANLDPSVTEADWQYYQNNKADPLYDWKQTISFFGKVVDDNEQPISEATINFKWNDLSPEGTSTAQTTSDANGLFSLVDRTGKLLAVSVGKEGYYARKGEVLRSFEYANPADGLFTPNPSSPIVYHLRKKGTGTDLITSQYGMKPHFGVTMPLDGTPVQVDLLERKTGTSGQLKVSQIKPPSREWKQATEWSFRMEIPDGGFVEYNDEFPFEAPESGYESVIEFQFRKGETNWAEAIKKDFYIKYGNPPRYGRLHLDTLIEMGGARFTYAINPDGSRNLEPK